MTDIYNHFKVQPSEQQNVPLGKARWNVSYKHNQPHNIVKGLSMSWERCIARAESFTDVLNPPHANLRQIELWKFDQNVNAKMAQYSPLPPLPTKWIIRLPLSYLIEAWQNLAWILISSLFFTALTLTPKGQSSARSLCGTTYSMEHGLTKNSSVMFVITVPLNGFERVGGHYVWISTGWLLLVSLANLALWMTTHVRNL